MKLYINNEVVIVNNPFEQTTFIYNRVLHQKFDINEDMFNILEYIYNNHGITLEELNKTYLDIEDVINELIKMNIIKTTRQKKLHNIKRLTKENYARLFVELTDKCNLRCKHCYGSFNIANENYLSIENLDKVIKEAVKLNVYQFDLTGGEPLLYRDLEIILDKLYQSGMLVTIFTNLTNNSKETLDLLEKYHVKKVITSIDSHLPEVHDEFRGVKGSLERTLKSIKYLRNTGIEIGVNTMVGKHNLDHIEDTIKFIKELDLPCVLDAIIPSGRAKELKEDMYAAVQKIHDLYTSPLINIDLKITDCGVGTRFLYLKSNGNICMCPSLTEFVFGNIKNSDTITESWQKMHKTYKNLSCHKECNKKDKCNGGCRARAYHFNNDIYSEDLNSCILAGECIYGENK